MSYTKCANKSSEISMFRFPVHDRGRLLLWIRNSGNIYLDSLSNEELRRRYICASHFPASSIHKGSMRSRLIGPAVPVRFQSMEVGEVSTNPLLLNEEAANMDVDNDVLLSPETLKVKTPTKFYQKRVKTWMVEAEATSPPSSLASMCMDGNVNTPTQRVSRKCLFEGPKKRLSRKCLFEDSIKDTPRTQCLKRTSSKLLKKVKAERAQISRLQVKCKKTGKGDDSTTMRSTFSKTLAHMQHRKEKRKQKWTTQEKNVCLTMFYKSPSTYSFLRRQGVVLAAPSTIRRWLSKSNCLPGLSSDVFKKIKKRFENASLKEKACVICFDEMSIMANLEYSKKYDLIEGFEDLGGNRRYNKVAKYALVFLVRAMYGQWKLPVAYFLTNSNVKAEMLQVLLKSTITKLFENGLLPKVVVCDQATTNQTLYKKLGVSEEAPFFCDDRKLFAVFDVPHLIKNIRNNFLANDYTHANEQMSFQDIVKTYEIDKMSKVSRSLTKITDKHINPNPFQKMTVSLATQIFSNSVAAAIKTVISTKQLDSETANATAKFIQVVKNMFDALNSQRQYNSNPYKHAISKKSKYAIDAIIKARNIFKNLHKISYKQEKDGQRKRKLTRPPSFNGVVQTCEAVLQLFNEETSDPNIKYIITRKLNQDVIENLFARFRQKRGSNRNPSGKLLRTIFRSTLINSLIKLPQTKNCEDEEGKFINLPVCEPDSTAEAGEQADLSSTENIAIEPVAGPSSRRAPTSINSEHPTINSEHPTLTQITLEECSFTYFAGYLAKSCIDKNSCQQCAIKLVKEINLEDETQLLILNKSYECSKSIKLKMPSDNLIKLVRVAIECFNSHFDNIMHTNHIKLRLFNAILDFLKCEAPESLNISCEKHVFYIIEHMILVKLHFYCKNTKTNILERVKVHPKLRILKNK